MLLTRDPLQSERNMQTESEGWKKIFHGNGNDKKAGLAILISDKIDFKTNSITKENEGHYIVIKASIQEENITHTNIFAANRGALKYVEQILTDIREKLTIIQL